MDSLSELCIQKVSESLDNNRIHRRTFQELPIGLLKVIAPHLSAVGLSKVHWIYLKKGFDVQQYWLELYRRACPLDVSVMGCSCHDPVIDWRQRFLMKVCKQRLQELERCQHYGPVEQEVQQQKILKILENPLSDHQELLGDFNLSTLHIESRLLPSIQTSEKVLQILQRNLKELVLSHYRPEYNLVLRQVLERLIHCGGLRKLTLKHPKNLDPAKLFSILEVCSGRCRHGSKRARDVNDRKLSCKRTRGDLSCTETKPLRGDGNESTPNRNVCVDGDKNEAHKFCRMEKSNESLSERKHCDSCTGTSDESIELSKSLHCIRQLDEHPEIEVDDEGERKSLYDQCFAPINDHSDSLTAPDISQGSLLSRPVSDDDGIFGIPSGNQSISSMSPSPQNDPRDGIFASPYSPSHGQCDRPVDHCIQHLVLCGFTLETFNYSEMFYRVLANWPGIQELEFIDNLMFVESCQKVLTALLKVQKRTQSLQRLHIEDSHVGGDSLLLMSDLLLRSTKLGTLELQSTELRLQPQLDEKTFHHLSVLKLSDNELGDVTYLERALLHPDCAIRHLDLKHCCLESSQLDRIFVSATENSCLRELIVSHNEYHTESCGIYDRHGNLLQLPGLILLLQSSPITKLDMSSCQFTLQGWNHRKQFVEALQQNRFLRQLLLTCNDLTDECLGLLAHAFICPSTEADIQAPRLCLQISYNEELTVEGLRTFRQALQVADASPDYKIRPPQHMVTTIGENQHSSVEHKELAQMLNLTVNKMDKQVWLQSRGGRHTPSDAERRSEHVHIM